MYTKTELNHAKEIISRMAQSKNIPESQLRSDMQEAISYGMNNPDPNVQAQWDSFQYAGTEPTIEEFILWMASKVI